MKTLLLLLALMISSYAGDLKVTTLDKENVNYNNGQLGNTQFRILCINGYKWLQFGINTGSVSQMFESGQYGYAIPIKCENK